MINKRKLITDYIYNLLSSVFPIIVLQIIIFPLMNKIYGAEKYGLILAIIALFTMFSSSFGNVLNNVRLLDKSIKDYKEGNYIFLLVALNIINVILMLLVAIIIYEVTNIFFLVLIGITGALFLSRQFMLVYLRIKLNYNRILWSNVLLVIGYLIGIIFLKFSEFWIILYILGLGISLMYIYVSNKEFFGKLAVDSDITGILKQVLILLTASFLVAGINYFDRILLLPLLGAVSVSIFYASSIFGKMITQLINPINNVMLSHLANFNAFKRRFFLKYLMFLICISVISFIAIIIFGEFLLKKLYPNLYTSAISYLPIAGINAILVMIYASTNPFLLRYYRFKWQIYVNLLGLALYVALGVWLSNLYGLTGFYFGVTISNFVRSVFIVIIVMFIEPTVDQ